MGRGCRTNRVARFSAAAVVAVAGVLSAERVRGAVIVPAMFEPRVSRDLGVSALWNATGDFNGDGRIDVAVGTNGPARITTFYTQADGRLPLAGVVTPTASMPTRLSAADFDGDGRSDLLYLDDGSGMKVRYGTPYDTFTAASTIGPNAGFAFWGDTAAGDLNADGRPDALVAVSNSTSNTGYIASALALAGGGFAGVNFFGTSSDPDGLAVADLNGDGYGDVIIGDRSGGAPIKVAYGSPAGAFTLKSFAYGDRGYEVVARDFNGDGVPDVAVPAWNNNAIAVLLTQANGDLGAATFYAATSTTDSIAAGDFNADGRIDLVAASEGGSQVSVLHGNGDGTFGNRLNLFASASGTSTVRVADLDGNGYDDITVAAASGDNLDVFYAIPEPSSAALLGAAALSSSLRRRRPQSKP